ncbi:hypothetical protein ACWPKO_02370 [Coraliomargarita sp. W4R53]
MKNPFKCSIFKGSQNKSEAEDTDESAPPTESTTPIPSGWIGVDLDGTLAEFHQWEGIHKIGVPVPRMVERVKNWLEEGKDVRIFTARVGPGQSPFAVMTARLAIRHWSMRHLGRALPVTATKDFGMIELWDDRAVHVIANTGLTTDESSV